MKRSAMFTHSFHRYDDYRVLKIVDHCDGLCPTVTNDMENVLDRIIGNAHLTSGLRGYIVVYRDSEGVWDGWDVEKKTFIICDSRTSDTAIKTCILKMQGNGTNVTRKSV